MKQREVSARFVVEKPEKNTVVCSHGSADSFLYLGLTLNSITVAPIIHFWTRDTEAAD